MPTPPTPPTADRVAALRAMLAKGPLGRAGDGAAGVEGAGGDIALGDRDLRDEADRTRTELDRIVADYLGGDPALHRLADDLVARGRAAMETLRAPDAAARFAAAPQTLGDLEAIVRTDGSRPSFLVRRGTVDLASSPIGTWRATLEEDAGALRAALACVGRIDDPSDPAVGYIGTGVLVGPDLILTNRHVLQGIGWPDGDGWALKPGALIDFGREFRGDDSVNPRALEAVVYAGREPIETAGPIAHSKLDLAAITLAPADPRPAVTPLEIDVATDWAGAGGPEVYITGYPARPPAATYPATLLEQLFQQTFKCKRLAPGLTAAPTAAGAAGWTMAHDATTLGGNSGSVVLIAGRATVAAALHYGGRRVEPAENWGHVLGLTLDAPDARGRTLRSVLDEHGVRFRDRAVGAAGPPGFELAGS